MTVAVFLLVLACTLTVGAIAGTRVRTARDYYIAGGGVGAPLLVGTFLASNVSAALFLGATNAAGRFGYAFWWAYVPTAGGFLLCLGLLGPAVRRLAQAREVFTFPEILGARFASQAGALRLTAALAIPLLYLPYVAAQLDGVAAVVSAILHLDGPAAGLGLPSGRELGLCGVMAILLAYTMWGGMKAVIWTDLLQMGVLVVGIGVLVPVAAAFVGDGSPAVGAARALDAAPAGAFQSVSKAWPWSLALGQLVWLFAIPAQPHLVTRILAARDTAAIRRALPWCLVGMLGIYLSTVPVGLLGRVVAPTLGPGEYYYIVLAQRALGPLLAGVALAGVAAAALSTGDTEVALAGQAVSRDLYQRHFAPHASPARVLGVARLAVLATALATFAIAWWRPAGIYWMGRASAALFASAFFVPLVGGVAWRRASGLAALGGVGAGLAGCVAVLAYNGWAAAPSPIPDFVVGLACSAAAFAAGAAWRPADATEVGAADLMAGRVPVEPPVG